MTSLIKNLMEMLKHFEKLASHLHKFVEICQGLDSLFVCT
jgi:hypothetical protein